MGTPDKPRITRFPEPRTMATDCSQVTSASSHTGVASTANNIGTEQRTLTRI